ncbi:hypothetical protein L1887_25482 [Cichorium endivia]|nr:hypothetical protein L1887_25482 [Cichorium endivia]
MDALGSAVVDGAKSIFKLTLSGIKTLSRYEENICDLQGEISILKNKKMLIEEDMILAKLEGKTPKQQVNEWLRKVSRAEDAVRPLLEIPEGNADTGCFKMLRQYQQCWKVAKKLEQVKELNSTNFEIIAPERCSPIKAMEEMSVPSLVGLQAASDMKKLLEILNSDDIRRIAVWGKEIPEDLGSLSHLRELNLSCTRLLKKIVAGSISGLSSLETLDMSFSAYDWNPKMGFDQKATFDELSSLGHLSVVKIRLDCIDCLAYASPWIKKLKKFDIQLSPRNCDSNCNTQCNEKRLVLRGVDLLQENLQGVLHNTNSLSMLTCQGMAQRHWLSLSSLISLTISNCNGIRILMSQERSSEAMFPTLQHLVLEHLNNLETIVEGIHPRDICLSNLKTIQVLDCPKLKGTISYAMLRHVKKLEEIKVSGCKNMCRIIESGGHKKKTLPVLRVIEIRNMVKLRIICDGTSVCPLLQQIEVSRCSELKKLPISVANSCSLKEIRGDINWWNNLVWENHDDKSFFLQHFQAYP